MCLEVLEHFVASGDRRWWWEDFREESVSCRFPDNDSWRHLPELVPDPEERVWFIVEDNTSAFYPVYEANSYAVRDVISECYAFEYYLADKQKKWLLCETHHSVVYAVGSEVQERLRRIASRLAS